MATKSSEWLKTHPHSGFILLAYGFSWLVGIPLAVAAMGWGPEIIPFSWHYLFAFGPMIAAFIMTLITTGPEGTRELLSRLFKWRVRPVLWVAALSPLWLYAIVAVAQRLIEGAWPDPSLLGQVNFMPQLNLVVAFLLWTVTFGLGEEAGWRGYLLPRLQQQRSAMSATWILTGLWALWHLPLFFYVLDITIVVGWLLGLLAGTILFTWLYNSSGGSVLMVFLWHGAFDFITASQAGEGMVAAVISGVVMVWALVIVFVYKTTNLSPIAKHTI